MRILSLLVGSVVLVACEPAQIADADAPLVSAPTFSNPIIPGFAPDPSIVRVDDDFSLFRSTFEYFPCIAL